jgi:hypothetical protein
MSVVRRFRLRRSRRAAELAKLLAQLDRMAEERRPWQASRSKRIALGRLS